VVRSSGLQIHVFRANIDRESDEVFDSISQLRIAALSVTSDPFFDPRREKLVALSERYAVPTICQFRICRGRRPVGKNRSWNATFVRKAPDDHQCGQMRLNIS
jgi:hypothetical protein